MKRILLADSGSTKTDWAIAEEGRICHRFQTKGINPVFQHEEEIVSEIAHALLPEMEKLRLPPTEATNGVESIFFYGAGCASSTQKETVRRAVSRCFPSSTHIQVESDMLAAARALCGNEAGIACILGTGSNSCFYDGKEITANVSPLGFILGDEGSGAYMGKVLVGDLLKNQLPAGMKEEFMATYGLQPADIIERVYRQPFPNRFLAGFSPFIGRHLHEPPIRNLALNGFKAFIRRNVMQYDYRRHSVHFTGSVAFHFREVLAQAAAESDIRMGRVCQSPLEGLVAYHTQ